MVKKIEDAAEDQIMPKRKAWRVLKDFDYAPGPNVVIAFRKDEIKEGLTRDAIEHAGDRIEEVAVE